MKAVSISSFVVYPFVSMFAAAAMGISHSLNIWSYPFFIIVSMIQFFPWLMLSYILAKYTKKNMLFFLSIPFLINFLLPGIASYLFFGSSPWFYSLSTQEFLFINIPSVLSLITFYKMQGNSCKSGEAKDQVKKH